jgi:hypothetical protein
MTKNDTLRGEENTFFQGLDKNTTLKYASDGVNDWKEIYKRIRETEDKLVEDVVVNSNSALRVREKNLSKNKWCKLHRTNTHSNEECLTQRNLKEKSEAGGRKINSVGSYSLPIINVLISKLKNSVNITIDSGSSISLINKEIVQQMNLKILKTEPIHPKLANGMSIEISEICVIELKNKENQK